MTKMHVAIVATLTVVATAALPHAANAYWRGGVFFGFPPLGYYYPPPVYYAPPAYYAPPPVVYDPQAQSGEGPAVPIHSCEAGAYVCPLSRPVNAGSPCSCPTERGGRAGGIAR